MTKKKKEDWTTRDILSSAGAVVAIITSFASMYQSWQTSKGLTENLLVTSALTGECDVEYQRIGNQGAVGICWRVTVSNSSGSKLSIIDAEVYNLPLVTDKNGKSQYRGRTDIGGFRKFEALKSRLPLEFPITLDGGEAKTFLLRVPVIVPPKVAAVIASILPPPGAPGNMVMGQLDHRLFQQGIDYQGGKVLQQIPGSFSMDFHNGPILGQLELHTGRGRTFYSLVSWPPPVDGTGPAWQ